MAVDITQGGLNWKVGLDTSPLENDAQKIEEVFNRINQKQLEENERIVRETQKQYRSLVGIAKEEFAQLPKDIQASFTAIQSLTNELDNIKRAEKQLTAEMKLGRISLEEYNSSSVALANLRSNLTSQISSETNAIRQNIAVQNMANGSLDQKRAKLQSLITQWSSLTEAEKNNANTGLRLQREIRNLDKEVSKLDRSLRSTSTGSTMLNKVLAVTAGLFTISQGTRLINDIVTVRGEIEQLEVAFSTMLGSKTRADQLMKEVMQVATTTPYTLTEVADATKQLLAYGFAQEEIKQELLAVGNVASGVGATFQEVAYAYGTLKTQGRAYARDIRQFTTRGIPIVAELAKQFNVTETEINNMVSAGKIGFPEVQKAFQSMTGAGGIFFNLMEKQSQTVTGEIAKLQDRIQLMFNEIGKGNDGLIKSGISGLSFLVENYESVVDILGTLIVAYGSYRAALILTAATNAAMGTSSIALGRILVTLRGTIQSLHASLVTSPVGAYTAVITALGLAFYSLSQTVNTAKQVQDNYNRVTSEGLKAASLEEQKINDLIRVLNDEVSTRKQKEVALKNIRTITADYLKGFSDEEIAAGKAQEAIDQYTESIKENVQAKAAYQQYNAINEQLGELEANGIKAIGTFRRVGEQLRNTFDPTREISLKDWWKQFISGEASDDLIVKQAKENLEKQRDELMKAFNITGEMLGDVTGGAAEGGKVAAQTKAYFEEVVKVYTEALENLDSSADDFLHLSKTYKDRIREAQENLKAFSIKEENKEIANATKERKKILDELQKMEDQAYKRSFEKGQQEIEDIRRRFEEIRKEAREAGLGAGVLDRIDKLEETTTGDIVYRNETEKLKEELEKRKKLYLDYQNYASDLGVKAANERFGMELDIADGYFNELQQEYAKLAAIDPMKRSGVENERLKFVQEQIDEEVRIRNKAHQDLLKSLLTFNDQKRLIEENYERDKQILTQNGDDHLLGALEERYNEELRQLQESSNKKTAEYRRYLQGIEVLQTKAAKDLITELRGKLEIDFQEGLIDEAEYNRIIKLFMQAEMTIADRLPNALRTIGGTMNEIASSMGDINSGFAKTLSIAGNLVNRVADIQQGLSDFKAAQDSNNGLGALVAGAGVAGAAIGGVMSIVNVFKEAQAKQIEIQREALAFQKKLYYGELSLNKLIRERRLEEVEFQGSTLEFIERQKQALSDSLLSMGDDLSKITEKFNKTFGDMSVKQLLSVEFEDALKEMMYYTGETQTVKTGLFGLGRKEVQVMKSLAGLSFEEIEQLSISGKLTEQAEEAFQKLKQIKEEGKEAQEALKELEEQLNDIFTGGVTAMSIADTLIAGFREGKRAAADFGDDLEAIIVNALLSGFKYRTLEAPLNAWIDDFAEKAQSDDRLDPNEILELQRKIGLIVDSSTQGLTALEDMLNGLGMSLTNPTLDQPKGLSGAIRRELTEETGSELTGLYRAMYDLQKAHHNTAFEHLQMGIRQVNHLNAIELNTGNTVDRLDAVIGRLDNIEKNTKEANSKRGYTP